MYSLFFGTIYVEANWFRIADVHPSCAHVQHIDYDLMMLVPMDTTIRLCDYSRFIGEKKDACASRSSMFRVPVPLDRLHFVLGLQLSHVSRFLCIVKLESDVLLP